MTIIRVTDIRWDTSGEDPGDVSEISLPSEIEISLPDDLSDDEEIEDYISDRITEITGFCHYGFSCETTAPALDFGI